MRSLTYINTIDNRRVDPRWKGERGGKEVLFKRVVAGVSIPKPDQPAGAVIVLGERYAEEGPPVFEALGAKTGEWMHIEKALRALRRALKVGVFVSEPDEEALDALRRVPDLRDACSGRVPCAILAAPPDAVGEIGRQRVDRLGHEKRLFLGPVKAVLDQAAEPAALALQCVAAWALKQKAHYEGRDDLRAANQRRARSYAVRRPPDPGQPVPWCPPGPTVGASRLVTVVGGAPLDLGRVGHRGGPLRPDLRERNRRRARSYALRRESS